MKLEFLKDTSQDGHYSDEVNEQLIRLYDFDAHEAKKFCTSIQNILITKEHSINLNSLDFIEPVNCNLMLQLSDTNGGISTSDYQNFVCELTIKNYQEIIKLCEPFSQNKSRGFAWLYELDSPIDFLFSPHGTW